MDITRDQAIRNVVASAEMEGLYPTHEVSSVAADAY